PAPPRRSARGWRRRSRASRLAPGGHDQVSMGRKGRPARPPPTAARRLAGLATMPRGVSESDFAASAPPASSVRRGTLAPARRKGGGERGTGRGGVGPPGRVWGGAGALGPLVGGGPEGAAGLLPGGGSTIPPGGGKTTTRQKKEKPAISNPRPGSCCYNSKG